MKHLESFLTIVGLLGFAACDPEETTVENKLVLHYSQPARYFEESLPLGNGQLGALVYGGVIEERISLNDITLWTGEPDLVPWTPNAYKNLPKVRALLDKEDYRGAERENMKIEGHNSEIYQPLGNLLITDLKANEDYWDYGRSLDLTKAQSLVTYQMPDGCRVERESFVSAPDSVIVVRLKSYDTSLHQRIRLTCPQPGSVTKVESGRIYTEGYAAYSTKPEKGSKDWFHYDANRGIHFRTELRIQAPKGTVMVEGDSALVISGCDEAVLLLTNVTSYNGPYRNPVTEGRDYRTAASQRLDKAMARDYASLLSRHIEDYQRLFGRVSLDLGQTSDSILWLDTDQQLLLNDDPNYFNPDLEELYFQYGRYLLISSSRTEGVPANLQGLWNEQMTPPWSCNYTVNINVEENYWPSEVGALPEMHNSMLTWIRRLPKSGSITAQNYYGIADTDEQEVPAWLVCHNSDIWCMTNPVGYQNESPMWCCWPIGGAWVSTHLWEHYMFTGDRKFLAEAYPVMKGAARFLMQWLVEKDGVLMTSPSTTPENEYRLADGFEGATFYGGAADVAMIRELLCDVRSAANVLYGETVTEGDKAFVEQVNNTLARLMPYKIGAKGNLQEWYFDWEDKDPHHRHQSHLFGLYPGHHISVDATPELAQACAKTLEIKGDRTTGWSSGWRVNLFARLRDAKGAYHIFRKLMTFVHPQQYQGEDKRRGGGTYANLFDAHAPFQIDGNFGGTAGVMEMLVQSRWISDTESEAIVLPALPEQWKKSGHLRGVRLRGGYELNMEWKDGRVTLLNVVSHRSTPGKITVRSLDGQTWEF